MTVEEIKQANSMRSVIERYGLKINRAGFCSCPFHKGDKTASMKINKDFYYCFGCGTSGDIFTFIQKMDNCDFKTAFYTLGGEYGHDHRQARIAQYHAQKAKETREHKEEKIRKMRKDNDQNMHTAREQFQTANIGSDEWWDALDRYHMAIIYDLNMESGEY